MAQRGAVVAATVVGVLSGFYIYDEPLKKLAEEGKAAAAAKRAQEEAQAMDSSASTGEEAPKDDIVATPETLPVSSAEKVDKT